MRSAEVAIGRTFVVVFDHGDDFYAALHQVCRDNGIRQGYIPTFIAGFASADLVGACEPLEDPQAPVWSSVTLSHVEAVGGGTLAWDETTNTIAPHIHVSIGLKENGATAHTSHLLGATVQFLTEMIIVEFAGPAMRREKRADLYDVPILVIDNSSPETPLR